MSLDNQSDLDTLSTISLRLAGRLRDEIVESDALLSLLLLQYVHEGHMDEHITEMHLEKRHTCLSLSEQLVFNMDKSAPTTIPF